MDRYSEYSKVRKDCLLKTKDELANYYGKWFDSKNNQVYVDNHYYQLEFSLDTVPVVVNIVSLD